VTYTLLLDLDDTLLFNYMDDFLIRYLQGLGQRLRKHVAPEQMINTLLAATKVMIGNQDPGRTLEEVFDAAFYPALGLEKEAVRAEIEAFYREDFPYLNGFTKQRPEAQALVQTAWQRGDRVAIATNPLFPHTAIAQRVGWAGFSAENDPFAIVPGFETFHFAKPNPAYYAELLGQIGWPEGPMVMAGDDLINDIRPAQTLGVAAFWAPTGLHTWQPEDPTPDGRGGLADLLPWLEALDPELLIPDFDTPAAVLAILRATPAALATITARLNVAAWTTRPLANEWSVTEIICHLRDVEVEVNLPRLRSVLNETNPFLPGMDTDPWAEARQYCQQSGPQALADFLAARRETLALLEGLEPAGWERPCRHAIFGPTRLRELTTIMGGHERAHIRQVFGTLKSVGA
jgi:FMN phosphatase YigB (HAD superfamily)